MNTDIYPLQFSEAGSITFNASVADGGLADIRFRLEFNPYPDVDPSYDTETVTVSGASATASHVYAWSATDSNGDDAGANVVFSAASSATTDITYSATGTFTVKLTLTDSTYSDYTGEVTVSVVVS